LHNFSLAAFGEITAGLKNEGREFYYKQLRPVNIFSKQLLVVSL